MNILITGGCGFIGTNLISVMQQDKKYNIKVIDNESLGKSENIKKYDVNFVKADILDYNTIIRETKNIDTIIHLAADTRVIDSIRDPEKNFQTNVIGTMNILMAMKKNGIQKIINASTGGAILGEVTPPVNENMLPTPSSPYGASKLAVEGYLCSFASSYGIKACSLRFSNVYGPNSWHKNSVISTFIRKIITKNTLDVYGDGEQLRDYVYVIDLCNGILQAINSDTSGVYQLGTGFPTSINKLIELISNTAGNKYDIHVNYHPYRDGEIHNTWCDIKKAKDAFGYHPLTSLPVGIQNTWDWFCQNSK